ncbi:hypothetical protein QWY93_03485 [Echinicola jeungdonensis]|uniref:hypothetical protein n=1 Tax=Echinicola jeungdonensis TaxID=709343 RepID=UPI0025B4AA6A|nr:hypothetical protein [Echinicola jeungdonensis]MDN3668388.1 hypothetical protein [Echinicola jeungdonensis]
MKRFLFILSLLVLIVSPGRSQSGGGLVNYSPYENESEKAIFNQSSENPFLLLQAVHAKKNTSLKGYNKLVEKLDKRAKNKDHTKWFLGEVFYQTHKVLLKEYKKHSVFNDLLNQGLYDCVSGSAIYALMLERYAFDYKIIETDFHVFVLVNENGENFIFESTEPRSGFIHDPGRVKEYLRAFLPSNSQSNNDRNPSLGSLAQQPGEAKTIFKAISLTELAGLQYYNDAILHFNENALKTSLNQLAKAQKIYPSDRVVALRELLEQMDHENQELASR